MNETETNGTLLSAANFIAEQLRNLGSQRHSDSDKTEVLERDGYVELRVRGVSQELCDAMRDAGLDELRHYEPIFAARNVPNLAARQDWITLRLHTRNEALELAAALANEAFVEYGMHYLENDSGNYPHDPEMFAHVAAAAIVAIKDKCNDLGCYGILEQLLKRSDRAPSRVR